ncbi:VanZ like family protein [Clostridium acetireducens DSM 10703]|uniref:VanZ like family protein n=1 Tax=Clostridium acetireducens DSM 10703 TaxID=1121290 RepID=A0A1E8F1W2_9CLOT|nr:VanZ family protein [Clostridium acetireducens]OFI07637.1 VanZ like family protein [Clostridium acetireducens DSM 10703]
MQNKIKKIYLIIAVINTILGFISKSSYRNYIYNNNINDFGIADSAPNFFYIIGAVFFILYVSQKIDKKAIKSTILACSAGTLIYELEQYYTSMTFDIKDIIATILGAIICYYICEYLNKKYNLECEDRLKNMECGD